MTRQAGSSRREPFLATIREDIRSSGGFQFDTSHGMENFGERYLTCLSTEGLRPMLSQGVRRVAFVGTPCQIKSIRKIQAMGIVPSEAIAFCFGLFCSGNFFFGDGERWALANMGGFSWEQVVKINVKFRT